MDSITKSRMGSFFSSKKSSVTAALVVVAVVGIAGLLVVLTRASGFFTSIEPSQGTLSGNAQVVTDATAASGKAIQFSAPSTPPPPPTGGGTSDCPAFPAFPDENCTGWQHTGVTLTNYDVTKNNDGSTYNGSTKITKAGTVIDGAKINGYLCIAANNVTIKRSQIIGQVVTGTGGPYGGCPSASLPTNFVMQDVEIAGPGESKVCESTSAGINCNAAVFAVSDNNYTCERCNVHGWGSGFYVKQNIVIKDSYIHDTVGYQGCTPVLGSDCVAHRSCIGGNGAVNVQYIHNRVVCNNANGVAGVSGAIVVYSQSAFLAAKNVLVQNNYLDAQLASYCLYAGTGDTAASNVQVIDNRFGRTYQKNCGIYGPYVSGGTGVTLSGNAYTDGSAVQ